MDTDDLQQKADYILTIQHTLSVGAVKKALALAAEASLNIFTNDTLSLYRRIECSREEETINHLLGSIVHANRHNEIPYKQGKAVRIFFEELDLYILETVYVS